MLRGKMDIRRAAADTNERGLQNWDGGGKKKALSAVTQSGADFC